MTTQCLTFIGAVLIAATVQAQDVSRCQAEWEGLTAASMAAVDAASDAYVWCMTRQQPRSRPFIDVADPAVIELAIGRGFDAVGTHIALTRGAHEQILTQSPAANDAIDAGLAVLEMYLVSRLSRGKLRSVLGFAVGATHVYIGVRNMHVGRQQVP